MVNPFIDDREPLGGLGGLGIMGQAQMSERFYNPNADREYSKFQVRANEAEERKNIEDMYSGLKSWGKNPMFFETMVPPPGLDAEIFSNEKIRNDPAMDLMSLPFDADMTPSFGMKDIEKWMDTPRYEAKTNPNLGGAKVQQAGAFDFLERWMPWYDKEQDEKRYKPYIDPEIEQDRLEDEEKDKAEWLSEYGPRETSEFYPDKILRDLYPQVFGGQKPYTTDEELNNLLEGLEPEDLGMEPQLEAQSQWKRPENLEKTIKSLELRPEFEGWTHDEIKYWIINQARSKQASLEDYGIGSLDEYQMAELTEDQMNIMRPSLNQPNIPGGLNKEELWNKVKENEYEGWGGIFGIGAKPPQEPTTRKEYDDYYRRLLEGEINPDTYKTYWQT